MDVFTMVPFRSAIREMFERVEAFNALEQESRGRSKEKSQQTADKVTV